MTRKKKKNDHQSKGWTIVSRESGLPEPPEDIIEKEQTHTRTGRFISWYVKWEGHDHDPSKSCIYVYDEDLIVSVADYC